LSADANGFIGIGSDASVSSPVVARSPDGRSWTEDKAVGLIPAPGGFRTAVIEAVARHGDILVAAGSDVAADGSTGRAAFWSSTDDGTTWRRALVSGATDAQVRALTWGVAGWVAVGANGFQGGSTQLTNVRGTAAWTSADGQKWTRVKDSAAFHNGLATRVVANSTGYYASGLALPRARTPDVVWVSAGGASWTSFATPASEVAVVATVDSTFVVAGHDSSGAPAVWTKRGGDWLVGELAPALTDQTVLSGLAAVDGCWILVGTDTSGDLPRVVMWTSSDGSSWAATDAAFPVDTLRPLVATASGLGVIVGERGDGTAGLALTVTC
jgi:hypothetical protein